MGYGLCVKSAKKGMTSNGTKLIEKRYLSNKKDAAIATSVLTNWCGRWDLNPYGISPTTPSKWRVCRSTTTASLGNNLEYKNGAVERI